MNSGHHVSIRDGKQVKIKTRLSGGITLSSNTLVRRFNDWVPVAQVRVGDRVAVSRTLGQFGNGVRADRALADGPLSQEFMSLTQSETVELLRQLWCRHGVCQPFRERLVEIYLRHSERRLCEQVAILLRRFGILTAIKQFTKTKTFEVRVVTKRSQEAFSQIAPVTVPGGSHVVLDTLPLEVIDYVNEVRRVQGFGTRRLGSKGSFFEQTNKLRFRGHQAPTYSKVERAQELLKDPKLKAILEEDVVWDEVISVGPKRRRVKALKKEQPRNVELTH